MQGFITGAIAAVVTYFIVDDYDKARVKAGLGSLYSKFKPDGEGQLPPIEYRLNKLEQVKLEEPGLAAIWNFRNYDVTFTGADAAFYNELYTAICKVQPAAKQGKLTIDCEQLTLPEWLTPTWVQSQFPDILINPSLPIPDYLQTNGPSSTQQLADSFLNPNILQDLETLVEQGHVYYDDGYWHRRTR